MQVMSQFKIDTNSKGDTILLRLCSRADLHGNRHVPVVPIEDLATTFQEQMDNLGVTGPTTLFKHVRHVSVALCATCVRLDGHGGLSSGYMHLPYITPPQPAVVPHPSLTCPLLCSPPLSTQLYHNVPTHLSAGPDSEPRTVYGLTGFTKDTVKVYVKEDPIYADQQPMGAADKAAPQPIVVSFVFQQCQASKGWGYGVTAGQTDSFQMHLNPSKLLPTAPALPPCLPSFLLALPPCCARFTALPACRAHRPACMPACPAPWLAPPC